MPIIANWLQPTNVLAALQAGSSAGLQARSADQRDAEMALRERLAEEENARQQQSAAQMLQYHYDSLAQGKELALKDDEYRKTHDERAMQQSAAKLLQDKAEADALAQYREGVLRNQAARNDYLQSKPMAAKTYHVGDHLVQVDPSGEVKTLFSKPDQSKIPMVSGVKLDPMDPSSPSVRLRADDPLLNKYLGTNAAMLGTNFVSQLPMSKKAQAPIAVPAMPDAELDSPDETDQPEAEQPKALDKATARQFLKAAGGNKAKARELARAAGYSF